MASLFLFSFIILSLAKPIFQQVMIFNPMDYGAVGDGVNDDAQALLRAWDSACQHNASSIFLIPSNMIFLTGPMLFEGPCQVTPQVQIQGTLKAMENLESFIHPKWIEFKRLNDLNISGGGILDGQGFTAWDNKRMCLRDDKCKDLPTSLKLLRLNTTTVSDLNLINSKGFHINVQFSSGITFNDLQISAPDDSPNTDGIHMSRSDNIRIISVNIGTGDDCISIGQGATNVFVEDVTCGPGHGISIGSLGKYENESDVTGVYIHNCTVSGTTNGVRIKTWPGSQPSRASNFTFEDIVMNNVSNPIIIDQEYCPFASCSEVPSQVKIENVAFNRISGTTNIPTAVQLTCSPKIPCENVQLHDINITPEACLAATPITTSCSNAKGIMEIQNLESCLV